MNPLEDWKAKLERAHFFKVQSGKITVCAVHAASSLPTAAICTVCPLDDYVSHLFVIDMKQYWTTAGSKQSRS